MLEKTSDLGKMEVGYPYLLGRVIKIHNMSNFDIVEYVNDDDEVMFHVYVDRKNYNISFNSIDKALLYAICAKYEHSTSWDNASGYICNMIGLE